MTSLLVVLLSAGCSAVHFVERDGRAPGYLELNVEPSDTEVYVDERFRGTAAQWTDSVMTLEAGHHRVRLSLDGHYTRRFDVRIRRGVVRRLEIVMTEKVGAREAASRVGRTRYDGIREARSRVSRRTYEVRRCPRDVLAESATSASTPFAFAYSAAARRRRDTPRDRPVRCEALQRLARPG